MAVGDLISWNSYQCFVIKELGPIQIFVTPAGRFLARNSRAASEILGEDKELDKLEEKIRVALKRNRIRIDIPFTQIVGDLIVDGAVTGKHARTSNWLVRVGTENSQHSYGDLHDRGQRMRPLSKEEKKELEALLLSQTEAQKAVASFRLARSYRTLDEVAKKAWKDAGGE